MKLVTRKELFEMKGRVLGYQVINKDCGDGYDLGTLLMMADFHKDTNDMSTMAVDPQSMMQEPPNSELGISPLFILEDLIKLKGVSIPVDFGYWGREAMYSDLDTLYLIYEKEEIQDFVAFLLSATVE